MTHKEDPLINIPITVERIENWLYWLIGGMLLN